MRRTDLAVYTATGYGVRGEAVAAGGTGGTRVFAAHTIDVGGHVDAVIG